MTNPMTGQTLFLELGKRHPDGSPPPTDPPDPVKEPPDTPDSPPVTPPDSIPDEPPMEDPPAPDQPHDPGSPPIGDPPTRKKMQCISRQSSSHREFTVHPVRKGIAEATPVTTNASNVLKFHFSPGKGRRLDKSSACSSSLAKISSSRRRVVGSSFPR